MIFISIPEAQQEEANQWVRDNCDPQGDTFTVNQEDQSTGDKYCLISLPDDGKEYTEKMKEHFGYTDESLRAEIAVKLNMVGKLFGKMVAPEDIKLQDIAEE